MRTWVLPQRVLALHFVMFVLTLDQAHKSTSRQCRPGHNNLASDCTAVTVQDI